MLFKNLRAGDEVILATPVGRGAGATFTFALAEVEAVKSALAVVAGYKFNLKDGRGRTVPHYILPANSANRQQYLGEEEDGEAGASGRSAAGPNVDERERNLALDALRIIRESDPADADDLLDLLGIESLVAFRRRWRKLRSGNP